MTLKQASHKTGRSESTLRRWIRDGKLKATLKDGKYHIDDSSIKSLVNPPQKEETTQPATPTLLISQMTKQIDSQDGEIAFLRNELSQQNKRHDTIVLQMTQQLDRAHLKLEDLTDAPVSNPLPDTQNQTSLWKRLLTAWQKVRV